MRTRITIAAAGLLLATLTACGSGGNDNANPAACKTALAENYRKAMADPDGPSASAPSACTGLGATTLKRLTGEVISEYLDSDQAAKDLGTALPTPSASVSVSPECRAWLEKELQDASDNIDGASGLEACGDLSEDELQAAIDQATEELSGQTSTP
jgi:predicted small lipoprotein YifL